MIAVKIPEANMPPMNRNAEGAKSIPPEIANPLVQPPAMLAPYCSRIAPMKPMRIRFHTFPPKIFLQAGSSLQRRRSVRLLKAPNIPPKNMPTKSKTEKLNPGGMT